MSVEVKIDDIDKIIKAHGVDTNGDVQKFLTATINRRIGKYMPHLTGYLETKAKRITKPDQIEVTAPYAVVTYYGNKMVNAKTGKGPAYIPNVGYRFPRGSTLKATEIPLKYTTTFNPKAGPFWDKRMMVAESEQISKEVSDYANRPR